jgi:hypothetical protein
MGFIINPYQVQPSGPSYGTLTTAWITATGETDVTILGALNTLESDLSTYGLTSKIDALYPFVGGTAGKHSYNFMNTAAYQITFNGGWTHSSTGALPNGTNAYANTGYNSSTEASLNSHHLSYYSRINSNGTEVEIGLFGAGQSLLEIRTSGTTYFVVNQNAPYATSSDSDSRAFYIANRTASNVVNGWKNGTKVATSTTVSNNLSNLNYYLGAANNSGSAAYYSNKECALASIGDGLTDTEAANFYTAVQKFQTTLSRQVGTPIPFAMPLDTYTGAAVAYSAARRLATAYTGPLIRVRRSSDNTEQDIGYDGSNVLDESALTTFVGAGNGFVTKWYDQSGNSNHAIQSTAANQPQIVTSGTVNTQAGLSAGKPCLTFDNTNDFFDLTSLITTTNYTAFVAQKRTSGTNHSQWIAQKTSGAGTRPYAAILYAGIGFFMSTYNSSTQITSTNNTTNYILLTSRWGSTQNIYINNSAITTLTGTDPNSGTGFDVIGRRGPTEFSGVTNTEIILYSSDKLSDLTGISDNINTFYSIY